MKNSLINSSKITALLLLILATSSCSKESCAYVTDCVETEPEGYMVCTNADNGNGNVAIIHQTTYNSNAPIGGDWNDPSLGSSKVVSVIPTNWKSNVIGNVFGIALDKSFNIYLSATDVYNFDALSGANFGSGGRCGIYKTNANSLATTTTLVTTFTGNAWNYALTNQLPNSGVDIGNSIGNIAYDKAHNQLFATNLEDGRIYRLDPATGNVKSVFDPFVLDTPSNGMVAIGERIWGIGVLTQGGITEVFFARTEVGYNSIWSIQLDASGEFIATPQPLQPNVFNDSANSSKMIIQKIGTQSKITDIEFSCKGKMMLAERGSFHNAAIFEYEKIGTTWTVTVPFYAGDAFDVGKSSAGGVDYGAREFGGSFTTDDIVWVSQNYAKPVNVAYFCYGVQGISSSGNSPTTYGSTDLFIDRVSLSNNKGGIGDVDVFDSSCPCDN
jgi:hypothetical protein